MGLGSGLTKSKIRNAFKEAAANPLARLVAITGLTVAATIVHSVFTGDVTSTVTTVQPGDILGKVLQDTCECALNNPDTDYSINVAPNFFGNACEISINGSAKGIPDCVAQALHGLGD